ncbi:MAG: hypothetical protein JWQ43_993, partial [Glaciihabitans sp.]|nr:hypothetical protein [Glaciihabitans sp.]
EGGTPSQLADLWAYEAAHNPDQGETYGWVDLPADCAAQIDPTVFGPPTYTGTIDSHPYASLALNNGVFVADAGANAILKVGYDGTVSTVAVLPAQPPVTVTAEAATANGFPACVAGFDYRFESVPTDVEIGPKGQLYVSTLPGGPEDPSLGGRGSVYTVNPKTGESALLATGFVGATGLGVSTTTGTVVVSELFGGPDGTGQISVIEPGETQAKPLISLPSPSAIELRESRLWVTTDSFVLGPDGPQPIGKLTFLRLTHSDGTTSLLEDSTTEGD